MAAPKHAPAGKKASPKKSAPRKGASAPTPKGKPAALPAARSAVKTKPAVKAAPAAKAKASVAKAKPAAAQAKPAAAKAKPAAAKTKPAGKKPGASAGKAAQAVRPATAPKPAGRKAKPSPAREARQAAAMKKAIEEVIAPIESQKAVVDAYMRDLDHPFKAELEALRALILGASDKISERIKWNAPSFFYKEDLAAFNPRATEYAHLILLFPGGAGVPAKSAILEGKAKDRREAKFHSVDDIQAKKKAVEKLVKDWVALRDA